MRQNVEDLLNDLTASGITGASELRASSDAEIARLEESVFVQFPSPYRTFLKTVGNGAGRFLRSDHWTFTVDSLLKLNMAAYPLLRAARLSGPWFCFATRIGEVYLFFLADGRDDDPPIFFWNEESDPQIEKGFDSFAEWLGSIISDHKSWQQRGPAC